MVKQSPRLPTSNVSAKSGLAAAVAAPDPNSENEPGKKKTRERKESGKTNRNTGRT